MQSTSTRRRSILSLGIATIFCLTYYSCDTKGAADAYSGTGDSDNKDRTTKTTDGPSTTNDQTKTQQDQSEQKTTEVTTLKKPEEATKNKEAEVESKEIKVLETTEQLKLQNNETINISYSEAPVQVLGGTIADGTTASYKGKKKKSYSKSPKAVGNRNNGGANTGAGSPNYYYPNGDVKKDEKARIDESTGYYTGAEGDEDTEENNDDGLAGLANGLDRNVPDVATLYERYNPFNENEWISADDEATSTFSIDVDNASYTNFRRYINQNQLPPKDAIRMEEWLNFFNYELEGPEAGSEHPLNITSEIGECPWQEGDDLVMIKMQAAVAEEEDLPPSNLVFLVDVSGSMNRPNKLPLVQESMLKLVKKLRPEDRMSIVTYAGTSKTILEPTAGDQKSKIENAINSMTSGGGTAGSKGIETAYQLCADNFDRDGNNRVILATDGDWNVGITDRNELKKLIEKKRESGIFLSVLGFGMGNLNDAMMETIADNGNGNYAYVDNEKEAERLFNYEFSGTMHVIAKDVKLQVVFDEEEVESYRLLGYENRVLENWMFNDDKIDAGDLGIGQNVVAFYQIKRKDGARGKLGKVDFRYKPLGSDQSTLLSHEFGPRAEELSTDFNFASCVAEFALCLRESEHRGTGTMEAAILRGKKNLGDPNGGLSYEKRVEFVGLLDPTADMWEDYVLEDAPDITEKETELKLYPNPARDHTTIEVPESISEKWSIQIYDMKGGLVRVEHFNQVTQGRVDVTDLTRGTYILKVYSAGNSYGYLRLVKS